MIVFRPNVDVVVTLWTQAFSWFTDFVLTSTQSIHTYGRMRHPATRFCKVLFVPVDEMQYSLNVHQSSLVGSTLMVNIVSNKQGYYFSHCSRRSSFWSQKRKYAGSRVI